MATITTTTANVMIPEIWADEIRAAYENNLVLTPRVKRFKHNGKHGDTIHIPDISNLVATDMTQTGEVTEQAITETEFLLTINKWKDASFRINDLVNVQSKYDLRSEYTKKAGYAIAKAVEVDLFSLFANSAFMGFNADGTPESPAGAAITLNGILKAQEYLLKNDVPDTDLYMFIPPIARTAMLQIPQFTSIDYVNKKSIVTGKIGEILGMEVFVSNNCPNYTITVPKGNCIIMHRDALVLAEQISPRVQSQYELRRKSWLVSCDVVYGVARFRTTNAVRLRLAEAL